MTCTRMARAHRAADLAATGRALSRVHIGVIGNARALGAEGSRLRQRANALTEHRL
jgi:hypothetical protein